MEPSKPEIFELSPDKKLKKVEPPKKPEPPVVPTQRRQEPVKTQPKAVFQGFRGSSKKDLFPDHSHEEVMKKMESNRYLNRRKEEINDGFEFSKEKHQDYENELDSARTEHKELDPDEDFENTDRYDELQDKYEGHLHDELERYTGKQPYGHSWDRSNDWGEIKAADHSPFRTEGNETVLDYTNLGSHVLNRYLRTGEMPDLEDFEEDEVREGLHLWAYDLMHQIDERRETENEDLDQYNDEDFVEPQMLRTLWRGVPDDIFEHLEVGDIIRDPGFMSTSERFGTASGFGRNVMRIQTGAPGYEVHPFWDTILDGDPREEESWHEHEYLMQPNTPLEYTGFEGGFHRFRDPNYMRDQNDRYTQPLDESTARLRNSDMSIQNRFQDYHFEVLKKSSHKKFNDFVGTPDD